ncbi:TPA: Tat pathway signal sequence, partial [Klebsiella pneumoniae CHS 04]|nr:Tat pathway signal sequence [Klebsiella pneumoniae CHS 04]
MLTRRHFLTTTGALLMTTLLPGETLAASLAEKVSETW